MTSAREMGMLIRTRREELGLAQADLGQALGVTRAQISNLERGTSGPSFKLLLGLIRILGFNLSDALYEKVSLLDETAIVGPAQREAVSLPHSDGVRAARLVGASAGSMEIEELVFAGPNPALVSHTPGHGEWLYVVEGSVTVQLGGQSHLVTEGESLSISDSEHSIVSEAESGSRVLLLSLPAAG